MTPLKINLSYKYPRNIRRIILGLITMAIAGWNTLFQLSNGEEIKTSNLILFVVFFFLGTLYFFLGMGKNPLAFMGESFISINDDTITLKNTRFSKEDVIDVNSILRIEIKVSSICISTGNNTAFEFGYNQMDEETTKKLKSTLISLCKTRNISLG